MKIRLYISRHIPYERVPLLFGTLLPSVATSYMLGTLAEIMLRCLEYEKLQ